jgi:hypothetical protein
MQLAPSAPIPEPCMTSMITPSTHRASFAIGDEATARRVVDDRAISSDISAVDRSLLDCP